MTHIWVMSSHKPIRIYMGGLILAVNTLYRLFCFFKLFTMVGKGLILGVILCTGFSASWVHCKVKLFEYKLTQLVPLEYKLTWPISSWIQALNSLNTSPPTWSLLLWRWSSLCDCCTLFSLSGTVKGEDLRKLRRGGPRERLLWGGRRLQGRGGGCLLRAAGRAKDLTWHAQFVSWGSRRVRSGITCMYFYNRRYSHKLQTINNYVHCPSNFVFARSIYLFHLPIFEKILMRIQSIWRM